MARTELVDGRDYVVEPDGCEQQVLHDAPFREAWDSVRTLALRLAREFGLPVAFLGTGGAPGSTLSGVSGQPMLAIHDRADACTFGRAHS